MKPLRLLALAGMILLLASCSFKQTWAIHGKWRQVDGTEVIEFAKDGTVTVESGEKSLTATYKLTDPKHLEIYFGGLGTIELEVSIEEDVLVLKHADGEMTKYQKMK